MVNAIAILQFYFVMDSLDGLGQLSKSTCLYMFEHASAIVSVLDKIIIQRKSMCSFHQYMFVYSDAKWLVAFQYTISLDGQRLNR